MKTQEDLAVPGTRVSVPDRMTAHGAQLDTTAIVISRIRRDRSTPVVNVRYADGTTGEVSVHLLEPIPDHLR